MRLAYHLWYRFGTPPWGERPREVLVRLVEDGTLVPGRAVDLGCGTGADTVFLAQRGFEVTGVDFAASAIARARTRAAEAGVSARFVEADLTRPLPVAGPVDLLFDGGSLDDLSKDGRARFLGGLEPLLRPGTRLLIWCFEWHRRWWERALARFLPFGDGVFDPGGVEELFGDRFTIERVEGGPVSVPWVRGYTVYLLTAR